MSGLIHAEVTDQFGTVTEILDTDALLGKLRPRQRAQLDALAADLIGALTPLFGGYEDQARKAAVAELGRLVADEAAYERVAERRGLLPL